MSDREETSDMLAHEVAAHMCGQSGTVAEPRLVGVDGGVRAACWFSQLRELLPGSRARAIALAEKRSPTHVNDGLYVLGTVPVEYAAAHNRGETVVFREESGQEWWVAGYADDHAVRTKPEFHPFGQWFLLKKLSDRVELAGDRVLLEVTEL